MTGVRARGVVGDFMEEQPMHGNLYDVSATTVAGPDLRGAERRAIDVAKSYATLDDILEGVYEHVAVGKGAERHGIEGARWEDQIGFRIADLLDAAGVSGGAGFTLGQAIKKLLEAQRKESGAKDREMVSAIGYVAVEIARGRAR